MDKLIAATELGEEIAVLGGGAEPRRRRSEPRVVAQVRSWDAHELRQLGEVERSRDVVDV